MGQLDGKVAVVTGGGSGIGLAVAQRFAEEGAEVVIAGRRQSRLDEACAQIGHGARGIATDMGDAAQVRALFESLERIDVLATFAGSAVFGPVDEVPPQKWVQLFEGRLFGQLDCCHYAVPRMPEGGVILLCSGIAARAHVAEYSGGSALCGAINALGKNLAVELGPRGIRVNVISPGLILGTSAEPDIAVEKLKGFLESSLEAIPLGRGGDPPDIADAALFLATCPYVSGQVVDVDGAWTAT